ncbi:MAG: hypothetical protein EXR95_03650 [Gemmatimonadetes bacterium]|nr:hypothetical protein [Gemmatimonadota bacterium]
MIALITTLVASGTLYWVSPTDPLTLVAVAAIMLAVGVIAAWLQAARAASVQPGVAMRAE